MKLFRTQENVPEIYVNKSRDFQILCRLKDVSFNSTKYLIDSLRHTPNTIEINETLLAALINNSFFLEYITLNL